MPLRRDIAPERAARQRFAPIALLAALTTAGVAAAAGSGEAYYERALMQAADARCHLFAPEISSALVAAEAQARGAALRGGATSRGLEALAVQAASRQAPLPCKAPALAVAAERVRTAFAGYSRMIRMSFPGDDAAWQADRTLPLHTTIWRLSQAASANGAPIVFGLAGDWDSPAELLAVAALGGDETPYAAQLMIRDPTRAPEPYLQAVSVSSWARLPLSGRAPPRSATLAFTAEARADADKSLLPKGVRSGIAFRFPASAARALAGLDPREAVTLVFLIQDASGVRSECAYVEVGDFAAGQAFLAAAAHR